MKRLKITQKTEHELRIKYPDVNVNFCQRDMSAMHLIYIYFYHTSLVDSWFWLVKGHGLIVMFSSILSDRLLSLTVYEIIEQFIATAMK